LLFIQTHFLIAPSFMTVVLRLEVPKCVHARRCLQKTSALSCWLQRRKLLCYRSASYASWQHLNLWDDRSQCSMQGWIYEM